MNEILLTKTSQKVLKNIIETMEGETFHHHFHILYDIVTSIKKDRINYLEIGTHHGASASLVLSHPEKSINALCVDIFFEPTMDIVKRNLDKFKRLRTSYTLVQGDSQSEETVNMVKSKITDVDLLLIDGDHRYDTCLNDFFNYSDLVAPGGYIVFDDYHDTYYSPQVKHAVDFIVSDLSFDRYEVIGCFRNSLKAHPSDMIYNNQFILRKK